MDPMKSAEIQNQIDLHINQFLIETNSIETRWLRGLYLYGSITSDTPYQEVRAIIIIMLIQTLSSIDRNKKENAFLFEEEKHFLLHLKLQGFATHPYFNKIAHEIQTELYNTIVP